MTDIKNKDNIEEADDDLDLFLDDVLDNFDNQTIPNIPIKTPAINNEAKTSDNTNIDKEQNNSKNTNETNNNKTQNENENLGGSEFEGFDDEMAKQLAQGMFQLLEGMDITNPEIEDNIEKMTKELEKDLKISDNNKNNESSATEGQKKGKKPTFQDTISETINNLKNSSEKVEAEVSESNKDMMEKMLKQMGNLVDEDFCDILTGVIDQLMSKELLYDSMKDLSDRYPSWIEENQTKLSNDEIQRYKNQYKCCKEIVDIFEKYSDNNVSKEDNQKVTELMQKMQEYGNPPSEILKELAPDMVLGPDDTPKLPDDIPEGDCAQM